MSKGLTEAKRKAIRRYDAANTKQVHLKLNINTDADILAHLAKQESVQGYIKGLIRKDMGGNGIMTAKEIIENGYYNAAVELMDDEIREAVNAELAPCTELEFLEEYMRRHAEKYGVPFTI